MIPPSISTLKHIRKVEIDFRHNKLNIEALSSLSDRLKTCIIEYATLKPKTNRHSCPIYTLTKLDYLELSFCQITQLHENISNLSLLQTLVLDFNLKLTAIPYSISKLTSLRYLALADTKIQSDSLWFVCKLPSLKELELKTTERLTTIPSQISQLTALRYLSLSDTKIKVLPTEIGLLTRLQPLDLRYCDYLSMCLCFWLFFSPPFHSFLYSLFLSISLSLSLSVSLYLSIYLNNV
jgi:Leucine-rich repeat (LRR) protein